MTAVRSAPERDSLVMVNYGHFTSMRVSAGRVRGLDLHLERLDRDARLLFGKGLPGDQVRERVRAALDGTDTAGAPVHVRVTAFAPDFDVTRPELTHAPDIEVSVAEVPPAPDEPLRVTAMPYERDVPRVKHLGTLGRSYQRRLARLRGFDDALFVDRDGQVTEGTTWNICFLDGDRLVWPSAPALPGTSMRLLRDGLTERGVGYQVRAIDAGDLGGFRAAYATNALHPVLPVAAIDETRFDGDDDIGALLADCFAQAPEQQV